MIIIAAVKIDIFKPYLSKIYPAGNAKNIYVNCHAPSIKPICLYDIFKSCVIYGTIGAIDDTE